MRTCQSTGREPTNCTCQSFGLVWPPKMTSTPRPPGAFPERRWHAQSQALIGPEIMHVRVYGKLRTCQSTRRKPPKTAKSCVLASLLAGGLRKQRLPTMPLHTTPHSTAHHTTTPHHHTTQHHTTPHRTTTPHSTHHATTPSTTTHHTTHNSNASNSCAFSSVWGGGRGDHLPAAISLDFVATGPSDHHRPKAISLPFVAAADHLPGQCRFVL